MAKDKINIMMLGDLIGEPGIEDVFIKLPGLKKQENIDFVIANGENSDNGFGVTSDVINKLRTSGVDVITSGNHIWSNKDAADLLSSYDYLLRPHNYPDSAGKGFYITEMYGVEIGVVNLMGRYQMTPLDCPFQTLAKLLKKELKNCKIILVDFHAEFPNEKLSLAYDFDGSVSVIAGTHTHVQTADEKILPKGTAYITDLGLCGGIDSVIGMEKDGILHKVITQISSPYTPSEDNQKTQGIVVSINLDTGKAESIKRFSV